MTKIISTSPLNSSDKNYKNFLLEIKAKVDSTRLKAAFAVNQEIIKLYWDIGKNILEKQEMYSWGNSFIEQLSADFKKIYPGVRGFSKRSLEYMRLFAKTYPTFEFTQWPIAQLPWGQVTVLLDKFKDEEEKRTWYANQSLQNGWSNSVTLMQIESKLYERQALQNNKTTNFLTRLPSPQSDMAQDLIKDPYRFHFISGTNDILEREIEKKLLANIRDFLLELGSGFAFVGSQYPITVGNKEYFIDLLFYNFKLRSFCVIELKAKNFEPEHTGKLAFYLAAIDNQLKQPLDNKTIGILLCKSKDKFDAEYALQNIDAPIGISEYTTSKPLPKEYENILPSPQKIIEELNSIKIEDNNKEDY
ncbi:MAG: PDDEXK nuclease domain-containing protein [Bdellovibrionota bacterium]